MDVGSCEKIVRGLVCSGSRNSLPICSRFADMLQIKVKSDDLPIRYTPDGLDFSDGSHLNADVIVFATGFKGNMRYMAEELFGSEIAEQMGDFWTLDDEGELKGAFKPCGRK